VTLARLSLPAMVLALACVAAAPPPAADEARRHFEIGLDLVQRRAFDSALAEFLRSRELYPTAAALLNAAVCLRELARAEEALDMYEELNARFGTQVSPADRRGIDTDVAALADRVGAIDVSSDPPGARVVVDGRDRGATPLAKGVRVTVGRHAVRVVAEGRAPFEADVDVEARKRSAVTAKLESVARIGTLVVSEEQGRVFEVLVDGEVVGTTPWRGTLSEGEHSVALRGEEDVGARPRTVRVAAGASVEVRPAAEVLPGELRVEPSPKEARVAIDGREVSRGAWSGKVPSGDHLVDVSAPWYEPQRLRVTVSSRAPAAIRPTLERVRRLYGEGFAGIALWPHTRASFDECVGTCLGNPGGVRVGYLLAPRLGLEAFALFGMFLPRERIRTVTAGGTADASSDYDEYANAGLAGVGASVAYRFFERTPLTVRLWAGLTSCVETTGGDGFFSDGAHHVHTAQRTYYTPLVGPEIRYGYRFARSVAMDVGLGALFYFARDVTTSPAPDGEPYSRLTMPPGPSVSQGLAWAFPLTLAIHLDAL